MKPRLPVADVDLAAIRQQYHEAKAETKAKRS
jgi:hypothetical protein